MWRECSHEQARTQWDENPGCTDGFRAHKHAQGCYADAKNEWFQEPCRIPRWPANQCSNSHNGKLSWVEGRDPVSAVLTNGGIIGNVVSQHLLSSSNNLFDNTLAGSSSCSSLVVDDLTEQGCSLRKVDSSGTGLDKVLQTFVDVVSGVSGRVEGFGASNKNAVKLDSKRKGTNNCNGRCTSDSHGLDGIESVVDILDGHILRNVR